MTYQDARQTLAEHGYRVIPTPQDKYLVTTWDYDTIYVCDTRAELICLAVGFVLGQRNPEDRDAN